MQNCKLLLFSALLISSPFFLPGQNNNRLQVKRCSVKTINYEQGLLNNGTNHVITDALGFTWVSTYAGMQRFNGYTLENINPLVNNKRIKINHPVFFFELKDGCIWISYKEGVLEYNPVTDSFKQLILLKQSAGKYFSIIPLLQKREGIYCIQENEGMVIYNREGAMTKKFSDFPATFTDSIFQSDNILFSTLNANNDKFIFIHNHTNLVLKINTQTQQFNFSDYNIGKIYGLTCSQNNLYAISSDGLTCINAESGTILKQTGAKEITNENVEWASILLVNKQQLLVALNRHLYETDTSCVFKKEFTTLNKNSIISTGQVFILYADKFKRIWLLTNDDIKRIQNVNIPFEHFIYPAETNNFVRSIYYDEDRHLVLAGCFKGSIQLYDTLANPLWTQPILVPGVQYINVIEKLSTDNYLLETTNSGWYLLNLPSKHIQPFHLSDSDEASVNSHSVIFINNFQRVNDSTAFIASAENISKCVFRNNSLVSAKALLAFNANSTNLIHCFVYASDSTLWAGTQSGLLYRFKKNIPLQTIVLPGNYIVRCMTEDAKHNIWIGTDRGLNVFSKSGALIKNVTRETGLLNDCIYALLPSDSSASVFASSNMGVSYVSLDGSITNYSKELGLQENEFNTAASVKTSNGKFFFGGVNGITAFYPSALNNISDTPVVNVTRMLVNDSLFNSSSGIWKGDSILLKHSQNHIQIDFAALGLLNNNEYIYKYRLKGFEEAWQITHLPTGIKYILQPGHYIFEMSCSPILTANSFFKKQIVVIVYPPWWQTWWFRIAIIVLFVFIIMLSAVQYNRRKFVKQINELKLKQQIQNERERISRDLHDNIGAYASAMSADIERMNSAFSQDKNIVFNLKNNVGEIISSLRETIWVLSKESISITGISDRFKNYTNKIMPSYPGIQIQFKEEISNDRNLKPVHALNIFRILQEAFHNAIKHSRGNIIIISIYSNDKFEISVEDNGVGLNNDNHSHGGHGLRNMELRAQEAGMTLQITRAENSGTKVMLMDTTT